MKKVAAKGNNPKNKRENGSRKTQTERKQKCAITPSMVQDIKSSGVKGVDNAAQSSKKSTGTKVMKKGTGSAPRNGTPAKKMVKKSGVVTSGRKKATKHNPPPKRVSIGGRGDKHLSRNKRNDTESSEEESVSTAGSSEEVTEEQISDEEEEERGSRKESSEGDSSEEDTESSGVRGSTEGTAVNGWDEDSGSSDLNSLASSVEEEEEETRVDLASAGLKDETQGKDISQEDTERSPGGPTRRRRVQPSCTTKPAKESKYKMFKRSKAEKQAEKDEKRRAKAEKQRLEKEAKRKAKEEKKNKKKAEKHASVTKEIQSAGSSRGKQRKNRSAKPTKNPEDDACGKARLSEVCREEDDEDESALTKAIKGQNRFMHLKEKGKDLRQLVVRPEEEISEGKPLVLESNKVRQRLAAQRKGATTFTRVSGWIQKNVPQKFSLRRRLSAWTRAMGVSRWLSLKVIKQNRSPKKSTGGFVKHRMALRVASKTSLVSKNKMAKEKSGEGGAAVLPGGEKDTEAKYAVVLPRMNGLGKTKTVETSQATPSLPAHSNMADSPGEVSSAESRPPKPGTRLVLPVKPDLSLLKSIRKSLQGDLSPGAGLSQGTANSAQLPEGSLKTGEKHRKAAPDGSDGIDVLQAARRKLDPSHTDPAKLSPSGGATGPTRARGRDPERDAAAGMPRSSTHPFPNGDAGSGVSGAGRICDEDTDREVAQLMCEGGKYGINQPELHWAGTPQMSGDPQVGFVILS